MEDVGSFIERNLRRRGKSVVQHVPHIKDVQLKESRHEETFEAAFDACYMPASVPKKFEPDESFSQCLIRMIDERGMKDPEVYKKANIDRKHFNHLKNDLHPNPKKNTVVALGIAMKLDRKQMDQLLERAGYVLSRSSVFDLIIMYCIEHEIYNIFTVNEILYANDQKLLGV